MFIVRHWITAYRLKCKYELCAPFRESTDRGVMCVRAKRIILYVSISHRIGSGTLEGLTHKPNYEKLLENPLMRFSGLYVEQCPPLMVRLQLFNNGEPFGLPVTTSYKSFAKRYK